MDFSLKRLAMVGFMVSARTVTLGKRWTMTAKIFWMSASFRYMVRPSMMTRTGASFSAIAVPQSSMADMAIWVTAPLSGSRRRRTAMVSGRSRLYQWA